jgi:uncharacterized protein YigA (DUF484 family)
MVKEGRWPKQDPEAGEHGCLSGARRSRVFCTVIPTWWKACGFPIPVEPAVSLLEYQNRLLRERCQRLHDKLLELVAIARDNDRLAERVQRWRWACWMRGVGWTNCCMGIKAILRDEFKADCIVLCFTEPPSGGLSAAEDLLRPDIVALFAEVFRLGQPQCCRLSAEQAAVLRCDEGASAASAALIPLGGDEWRGLLVLGSSDPDRFHAGVGTFFLERMGELVSQALQARLLARGWQMNPTDDDSSAASGGE